MSAEAQCAVCRNIAGFSAQKWRDAGRDAFAFSCEVCGDYEISRQAMIPLELDYPEYTGRVRAVLSHRIREANDVGSPSPLLLSDTLRDFILSDPRLPTPAAQATKIIRYIGGQVSDDMEPVPKAAPSFHASIGAPSRASAMRIAKELIRRGLLTGVDVSSYDTPDELMEIGLTLAGWELFEAEQQGKAAARYGFIALKFGDAVLDPFLRETIKPAVNSIGFDLLDLRDTARAGVIDNLLRAQIRDAAFVLVDLTHDNSGAYWEAGYAEGLGKPVLYLCEREKFETSRTHFDTNHCTTVIWSTENTEEFSQELVATLRRSLNLFADRK